MLWYRSLGNEDDYSTSLLSTMASESPVPFDPTNVNLETADPRDVICALNASQNEYNGQMGARISSIFVILVLSSAATFFPVAAKRLPRLRIPVYVYLFARYFGAGVIVATAFIHLLDPAYDAIGPHTCVALTGAWGDYPWCAAIVLTSVTFIFLLDLGAERYVQMKYGIDTDQDLQAAVTNDTNDKRKPSLTPDSQATEAYKERFLEDSDSDSIARQRSFRQQIAAFLILEFGVIFHSIIIGLNLGVVGEEFSTLYVVLVFHQSFEGLGIGARMSAIPFRPGSWLPWILCAAYGLTTPLAISVGLGIRNTYNAGSFTANVVSGVFDSMSAGILLYTGLVELLARDFLFNPTRTNDNKRLLFMVGCVLLGAGLMALLGKWA